jgi:hypothetical protein
MATKSPCGPEAKSLVKRDSFVALAGFAAAYYLAWNHHRSLSEVTQRVAEVFQQSAEYRVELCRRSVASSPLIARPFAG